MGESELITYCDHVDLRERIILALLKRDGSDKYDENELIKMADLFYEWVIKHRPEDYLDE
jgi:hypothetical protein